MPFIARRDLMSKRITGYVNWRRNRSASHQSETLAGLLADARRRAPDHYAVTGDLVNLGLDAEIANARTWLHTVGDPQHVSVVCGNHDAYVRGSLERALASWQPWCAGDDGRTVSGDDDYPVLWRRDDISIIGCNSARATAPFLATGYFREGQAGRLARVLEREGREGRCRIVLIHHPPVRQAAPLHKRLIGQSLFRKVIAAHGAELVLHGHTHLNTVFHIRGPHKPVAVVGVPSGAQAPLAVLRKPAARYNLFNISRGPRGWSIALQEYGYSGPGAGVGLIAKKQIL